MTTETLGRTRYGTPMIRILLQGLVCACVAWMQPSTSLADEDQKTFSLQELLTETPVAPSTGRVTYCQGGRFAPCVCPRAVSKHVRYRPALAECNGNAAAILSGKYARAFSVVVRDSENRDRWPALGFGGCSRYQSTVLGLGKCSAFKAQKYFSFGPESYPKKYTVHCFGASGYSTLFAKARRLTIKLADQPNSNKDPLARLCLSGATEPLN